MLNEDNVSDRLAIPPQPCELSLVGIHLFHPQFRPAVVPREGADGLDVVPRNHSGLGNDRDDRRIPGKGFAVRKRLVIPYQKDRGLAALDGPLVVDCGEKAARLARWKTARAHNTTRMRPTRIPKASREKCLALGLSGVRGGSESSAPERRRRGDQRGRPRWGSGPRGRGLLSARGSVGGGGPFLLHGLTLVQHPVRSRPRPGSRLCSSCPAIKCSSSNAAQWDVLLMSASAIYPLTTS